MAAVHVRFEPSRRHLLARLRYESGGSLRHAGSRSGILPQRQAGFSSQAIASGPQTRTPCKGCRCFSDFCDLGPSARAALRFLGPDVIRVGAVLPTTRSPSTKQPRIRAALEGSTPSASGARARSRLSPRCAVGRADRPDSTSLAVCHSFLVAVGVIECLSPDRGQALRTAGSIQRRDHASARC